MSTEVVKKHRMLVKVSERDNVAIAVTKSRRDYGNG